MKNKSKIFYRILDKIVAWVCTHWRPSCDTCRIRKVCECTFKVLKTSTGLDNQNQNCHNGG